ncbi:MAG: aldehyde dehydrogenase family protein, partial [Planctomycetales bacterium]|nr:aldehyde dehydrogenase family protein [Planctomycetales bacterium]
EKAADALMSNKFRGSGQTCVCANRVYVQASIVEEFSKQLAARVATLKVGNGLHPDTDLGPLIDRSAVEKVQRHIDNALAHGAVRITPEGMNSSSAKSGNFFPPTVLRGVTAEMECVHHETFGPVIPILEFENEDQVIDAANSTEYGLAAYVFTQNASRSERMLARLRFGHVGLNTGSGPTAEAPFGGMKSSGFGREGGLEGLHDFVDPQTIASP